MNLSNLIRSDRMAALVKKLNILINTLIKLVTVSDISRGKMNCLYFPGGVVRPPLVVIEATVALNDSRHVAGVVYFKNVGVGDWKTRDHVGQYITSSLNPWNKANLEQLIANAPPQKREEEKFDEIYFVLLESKCQ